ncbi:MAG TPA: hypothetical protein VGO47_14285, partial [Chlamydiales bacterium]|nr:hypothetical protein [Chlamydiales bacterium]
KAEEILEESVDWKDDFLDAMPIIRFFKCAKSCTTDVFGKPCTVLFNVPLKSQQRSTHISP